jgi:quinoprotein glucose dehydrogenase
VGFDAGRTELSPNEGATLRRWNYSLTLRLTLLLAGFAVVRLGASAQSSKSYLTTEKGEWPAYAGDLRNFRYSPLDQINASNFSRLEVAWRFKADNLGPHPEYKLEGTPLMVKGVVYATAGTRRSVIALDGATGELLWVHEENEGERGAAAPRQLSGRGVAYWSDGKGDERVVYVTPGYRLVALNAKSGIRVSSFGDDGVVDMKKFAYSGSGKPIDLITGEIGLHSTPSITQSGIVIVGSAFRDGSAPKTHNNTKGIVLAFDVRTGKELWRFNTIPTKDEFGYDTWLKRSADVNGNTGVWTGVAVDEKLGLAYLPVEDPTSDYYGGHRPGNNLFGDSLIAVDLKTGKRKWYFQLVHHPIWDYDISAPPLLVDIDVGGKPIRAVAQPTKQSWLYVFDRSTGEPVWPIEERPVPRGDVPGEWYSPTQPFPTKPPAYDRQGVSPDDLIDFTPELHAEAVKLLERYKIGPMFTPASASKLNGPLASLILPASAGGGTGWPGAAYDPETHTVYASSQTVIWPLGLVKPPTGSSDMDWIAGRAAGADTEPASAGGLTVHGLPLVKPHYGRITAIDLDRGTITWQVPRGETPDEIRNNPALKGLNIPNTGQAGWNIGTLVTKTLVIQGDAELTATSAHPRGAMLRAYDKATGREVGSVWMPAPQSGSPMTYSVNGRQYIVVAVSGGTYSGEYLAFALSAAN